MSDDEIETPDESEEPGKEAEEPDNQQEPEKPNKKPEGPDNQEDPDLSAAASSCRPASFAARHALKRPASKAAAKGTSKAKRGI